MTKDSSSLPGASARTIIPDTPPMTSTKSDLPPAEEGGSHQIGSGAARSHDLTIPHGAEGGESGRGVMYQSSKDEAAPAVADVTEAIGSAAQTAIGVSDRGSEMPECSNTLSHSEEIPHSYHGRRSSPTSSSCRDTQSGASEILECEAMKESGKEENPLGTPSPPPEPTSSTSRLGQQPSAWTDPAYVPPSSRASPPAASAPTDPIAVAPPPLSSAPELRRFPAAGLAADDANVDQFIHHLAFLDHPGMAPPPTTPTTVPELSSQVSGSHMSPVLASQPPSTSFLPIYHPRLPYLMLLPDGKTNAEGKTYSFASRPGYIINIPRRKYADSERLYGCNFQGCLKSYGTLNHLNAHVRMQRHGTKRTPEEFKEMRKQRRKKRKEAEVDLGERDDSMVAEPPTPCSQGSPKPRRSVIEPSLKPLAKL
ncbi:hypothetical protein FRB96_003960 [Tulasnella sp. 330]|nr:hypothetical protein FRB96_003960 [Tulasnella sp. 330]